MPRNTLSRKTWAALVLVAVGLTGAGVATGSGLRHAGSSHQGGYCAAMSDSVGLYVGNPVTQMGVRVGRIDRIRDGGDHVEVDFSLAADRSYPADVAAVTRSKSLLADRSLELVGNYNSGPKLTPGQCISLQHTATPKSLSEITGSAAGFIDSLAPDGRQQAVEQAVAGLARSLADTGKPANQLMQDSTRAMLDPDLMVSDIGSIIADMAPLTSDALQRWSSVRDIVTLLPSSLTALTYGLWPGLNEFLVGMGPLVAVLYEIQSQYGNDIWPMADKLADVIHVAATHAGDIKNVLQSIPPVAAFLANAANNRDILQLNTTGVDPLDLVLGEEGR